jgi:hypothetical protein
MKRVWTERQQHFWHRAGPGSFAAGGRGLEDHDGLDNMDPVRLYRETLVCPTCHAVYSDLDRARRQWEESKYLSYAHVKSNKRGMQEDGGLHLPDITMRRRMSKAEESFYVRQRKTEVSNPAL